MIKIENEDLLVEFNLYGAAITKLFVKKVNRNVVYFYDDTNLYKNNPLALGCTIGRVSGRIKDAIVKVQNNNYQLIKNDFNKNNLHGNNFLTKRLFEIHSQSDDEITFITKVNHLEDNLPGEQIIYVKYFLQNNKLHLTFKSSSKDISYLNLTNHSYFNLNLNKYETILDHELKVNSNRYIKLTNDLLPFEITNVDNIFDFSTLKPIGKDINKNHEQLKIAGGYDHPFIVGDGNNINHIVKLKVSDLTLNVYSNTEAVVIYSGNRIPNDYYINNKKMVKHGSIAIEPQGIPNNQVFEEHKNKNIYSKDNELKQEIIYEFI